eukprot:EG_transcript_19187
MLVDGGTLNWSRLFNVSLGSEGKTYFWRSIRVPGLNSVEILKQLQAVIADLQSKDVYVFCIVADNATAFQKTAGCPSPRKMKMILFLWTAAFEETGRQRCGEDIVQIEDEPQEEDDDGSEDIDAFYEAVSELISTGIFCCALCGSLFAGVLTWEFTNIFARHSSF